MFYSADAQATSRRLKRSQMASIALRPHRFNIVQSESTQFALGSMNDKRLQRRQPRIHRSR